VIGNSARNSPTFEKVPRLDRVHAATSLKDLATIPGHRLEKLAGDREGQYSIRINDQYRVCFEWKEGDAYDVEVVDYH
jgi:proteic killer suppression protein